MHCMCLFMHVVCVTMYLASMYLVCVSEVCVLMYVACVFMHLARVLMYSARVRACAPGARPTLSSMALVCAADKQKRARASVMGVAGKPTTTTPIFLANMALENALRREGTPTRHRQRGGTVACARDLALSGVQDASRPPSQ